MEIANHLAAVKSGKLRVLTQLAALAALVAVAPGALRALEPVVLVLVEILLEIGQAAVVFVRANGV
jgi:hypothetical protein